MSAAANPWVAMDRTLGAGAPPLQTNANPSSKGGVSGAAAAASADPWAAADAQATKTIAAQSAPVRTPGEFGPYDDASEHEIFGTPFAKGLREGDAIGFGLRSPNEGLTDMVGDTWENLKAGAKADFDKIQNWSGGKGERGPFRVVGEGIDAATTPVQMLIDGVSGTADLLQKGATEAYHGYTSGDKQRTGRGVGMLLSALGQLAMGQEGPEAAETVAKTAGDTLEARAPRPGNAILRATSPKDYLYGKNPGRALIDEPIRMTNSISNLQSQLSDAGDRLHDSIDDELSKPKVAAKQIDVRGTLQPIFDQALQQLTNEKGLRNRAGVIAAIKTLEDDTLNEHDVEGKTILGPVGTLNPQEANDLKRAVGRSTKWDTIPGAVDPEVAGYVNALRQKIYGTLKDTVNQAAPNVAALNERYSNVIEASRLIAKRVAREENADLGMRRALSRSQWLGATYAIMHGEPVAGGALAANAAARSTVGRLARARAMAGAARRIATPVGIEEARGAGTAAGLTPAAAGAGARALGGRDDSGGAAEGQGP